MDGGAWWAAVHGVAKSWTRLSDFSFTFHFYALEKEMATHSSVLAWRIPGTGEPGGLPSMGLHRVRHDWSHLTATGKSNLQWDLYKGPPGLAQDGKRVPFVNFIALWSFRELLTCITDLALCWTHLDFLIIQVIKLKHKFENYPVEMRSF